MGVCDVKQFVLNLICKHKQIVISISSAGLRRVLAGFTGFRRASPGFARLSRVSPGFAGLTRDLPGRLWGEESWWYGGSRNAMCSNLRSLR